MTILPYFVFPKQVIGRDYLNLMLNNSELVIYHQGDNLHFALPKGTEAEQAPQQPGTNNLCMLADYIFEYVKPTHPIEPTPKQVLMLQMMG